MLVWYLKKRIKDMRVFTKLFFVILLISLFISLTSGVIVYHIASDIILKKTIMQSEETVRQISENYDTFMTMIYNKLDLLAVNPAVQEELIHGRPEDSEESYYSGTRTLKRQMVMVFNSIYMRELEIYGTNGKTYYCSVGNQEPKFENKDGLEKIAKENKGAIVCINDIGKSGDIQIVKEVKDILSMESIGILRNAIQVSAIENIQKNVDFAFSGNILLLDKNNEIISGETSELSQNASVLFRDKKGSFVSRVEGEDYEIIYETSSVTGWKVIGIIAMKEINAAVAPLVFGILGVSFVGLMLGLLLVLFVTRMIVSPLRNTGKALTAFASGDFSVRLDDKRRDEFGDVNRVFNDTIVRVETLLEEISRSRLLSKEMEIKALQAQINPHFLYNALDTVNWMARSKREEEICDMVQAIGNLLRISISNKENIFSVRKELSYVEDYLYIQKKRFQNRFTVQFDVEEAVKEQLIPKLTIQPLVENAIVHSVEVSKEKVTLKIHGYLEKDDVIIKVEDNGVGIREEILEYLLKRDKELMEEDDKKKKHTGLGVYAVHQRLLHMYGEGYGLSVSSEVSKGTCFLIRLPYTRSDIRRM